MPKAIQWFKTAAEQLIQLHWPPVQVQADVWAQVAPVGFFLLAAIDYGAVITQVSQRFSPYCLRKVGSLLSCCSLACPRPALSSLTIDTHR